MKNEFLKKAAAVMTAATMLGTSAFAAVAINDHGVSYDSTSKQLTVKYDGVDASKQASLLVYNITALTEALADTTPGYTDQATTPIVAIDQTAASGEFTAVLPDSVEAGNKLAVKVGATGETTPAAEVFTVPSAAAIAYGDVDNDGSITVTDVAYIFSRAKKAYADDAIATELGISAAEFDARADVDGDGSVTVTDVAYVFSRAKKVTDPFPAEGTVTP